MLAHTQFYWKIDCMTYIYRLLEQLIQNALARGKSILLLGARQTCYLVCRTPRKVKLAEHIYALPWQSLDELLK